MRQSMFFHDSESHNFFQVLSDPTKIPHNFHIVSRDNLNGVTIPCSCPLIVQQTYFTVSIRISLIFPPLRPFFIFFFGGGGGGLCLLYLLKVSVYLASYSLSFLKIIYSFLYCF